MSYNDGRVPPHNAEAETAVLGSILLNNQCWGTAYSMLNVEDFYVDANKKMYHGMADLFAEGIAVDHVTLGNKLRQNGELVEIGGAIALDGLTGAVSTVANISHYADIVREKSAIRGVIYGAQDVVAKGFNDIGVDDLGAGMENLLKSAQRLARTRMPDSLLQMGDVVKRNYELVASGYRGIEVPWPSLDAMTAGFWPKTLTMFVARPGTGKCVEENTVICDPTDGVYRTVKDVVELKRPVFTKKDDGTIVPVLPDAFLNTGKKRCLKITLASGKDISVTPEHPLYSVDGWRRADEFSVGDHVEVAREVPSPTNTVPVPEHEVILLAALLAEGGYAHDQITFTNDDESMVDIVRTSAEKIGSDLIKTKGMKSFEWKLVWGAAIRGNRRGRELGPNPVRTLLDKYGCGHKKSKEKTIPDDVFGWSNSNIARFLGVLWGGDGSVRGADITITLASKEMVIQIQRLLLRLGILSCVRHRTSGVFESWRLRVYSSCAGTFSEVIDPVVEHKRCALKGAENSMNPNVDNIPVSDGLREKIEKAVEDSGTSCTEKNKEVAKILGRKDFSPSKLWRRKTVSRRLLGAFLEVYRAESISSVLKNSWDEIISIEDVGTKNVYDLTVNDTHNFLANDIVAHNTFVAIVCARHAWMTGKKVLIVSPEMSKDEIAERFFVIHAGVSYHNVITGQMATMQKDKLYNTIDSAAGKEGLWIMDSDDDLSPKGIDAAIRACQPDMVACDSIYDLQIKGDRKERALAALEFLKKNCKELGYASVGFAQQNRNAEKSKKDGGGARLGTIALADEIGQDAHAVFALEQSADEKDDRRMNFKVLKLRRGQFKKKKVEANWDFDTMHFDEIPDKKDEDFAEPVPF